MNNLIATLVAIVVMLMVMVPQSNQMSAAADQARAAASAQQMQTFTAAVSTYVKSNYAALAGTGTYILCSNTSTPWGCTINLQAAGNLPAGFSGVNPYGQGYAALVTTPTPGNITAFSVTWGGDQIPSSVLPLAAAMQGQGGGYWPYGVTHAAGTAQGAYGGWQMPAADQPANSLYYGSGRLANLASFQNGTMVSPQVLYRVAVPGAPTVNQMGTTLDMNNNEAVNASGVAVGAAASRGTSVTSPDFEATGSGAEYEFDDRTVGAGGAGANRWALYGSNGQAHIWNGGTGVNALNTDPSGNVTANQTITPDVSGQAAATAGVGCAQYGALTTAYDGSGLLQCVAGAWKKMTGMNVRFYDAASDVGFNTWTWNTSGSDQLNELAVNQGGTCPLWLKIYDPTYGTYLAGVADNGSYSSWDAAEEFTALVPAGGAWEVVGTPWACSAYYNISSLTYSLD